MHVHVSVLDAMIVGAYVVIWLYLLRLAATKMSDSPIGQALSFIH
jgi:hypothetical protein